MKGDFLKCGVLGWGMEIFWTGLHALGSENWKLTGYSSLWMFPIYGMAACIGPVSKKIQDLPLVLRGSIYMTGIFTVEYLSGMFLKHYNMCPWDYSSSPFEYKGVIRLDYAPVWFLVGIIYEKFLKCRGNCYMIVRDDKA